jgi:hypothetical protein
MSVAISLDHILSFHDLLNIYHIYCECYRVPWDVTRAQAGIAHQHTNLMRDGSFICKPAKGATFIVSKEMNVYEFSGYHASVSDSRESDRSFEERVTAMYGSR